MQPVMSRDQVFDAIDDEAEYQDRKWGTDKEQSLAGYFLIMEQKLNHAKAAWMNDTVGRESALGELLKVVTTGVRALEQYGTRGTVMTVNDHAVVEHSIPDGCGEITITDQGGRAHFVSPDRICALRAADPRDPTKGSLVHLSGHWSSTIPAYCIAFRETVEEIKAAIVASAEVVPHDA